MDANSGSITTRPHQIPMPISAQETTFASLLRGAKTRAQPVKLAVKTNQLPLITQIRNVSKRTVSPRVTTTSCRYRESATAPGSTGDAHAKPAARHLFSKNGRVVPKGANPAVIGLRFQLNRPMRASGHPRP